MTPNSIDGIDALLSELDQVREHSLAFDNCESNADVRCVAAPVREAGGRVVAGLSISVPVHRADKLSDELAVCAAEGARALSARLGFRGTVAGS